MPRTMTMMMTAAIEGVLGRLEPMGSLSPTCLYILEGESLCLLQCVPPPPHFLWGQTGATVWAECLVSPCVIISEEFVCVGGDWGKTRYSTDHDPMASLMSCPGIWEYPELRRMGREEGLC